MNRQFPLPRDRFTLIATLIAIVLFAQGSAAAQGKSASQADWERTLEAARKDGAVSVYFWQGGNLEKALQAFRKKYPEIRLSTVGGRGSSFIVRITTEMRAGKHLADICICGVTSPYKVLHKNNALDNIASAFLLPEVKDPSGWWQGKHHYQDPEGKHIFVYRGEPAGTRIFYNTKLVNVGEFKSYWDILDSKWKGRIVAIDPNESAGGWRQLYYNPQLGFSFLSRLFRVMEMTFVRDDRQATDWLATGKFALGFFITGVPEAKKQGLPVDELSYEKIKEPATLYSGPNGTIALMKQAPHPNAAKVFINWFLSREGQTVFQEVMNTPVDQVESMREDIEKDPVPLGSRRKKGREYIPMFTPDRMDAGPILKLYGENVKR